MSFIGTNVKIKGFSVEDYSPEFVSLFAGTNVKIKGFSVEQNIFKYFQSGDLDSIFYEVNQKGLHSKTEMLLETNPETNLQLSLITGLVANDKSNVAELVKLCIDKDECTANYNSDISTTNQKTGDLLIETAYILRVVGATDLGSVTDDSLVLNEPFVTKNSFVQPSWDGVTELEEILIIDNFKTVSTGYSPT